MATKVGQTALYLMAYAHIADVFKIILMATGFTWNRATQKLYADVGPAFELTTGNGYVQNTKVLTGIALTQDDTLFLVKFTWANPYWTASTGAIGPSPGAFIVNTTMAGSPLWQYIDFGGEGTEPDGGTFTITNPESDFTT